MSDETKIPEQAQQAAPAPEAERIDLDFDEVLDKLPELKAAMVKDPALRENAKAMFNEGSPLLARIGKKLLTVAALACGTDPGSFNGMMTQAASLKAAYLVAEALLVAMEKRRGTEEGMVTGMVSLSAAAAAGALTNDFLGHMRKRAEAKAEPGKSPADGVSKAAAGDPELERDLRAALFGEPIVGKA